MNILLQGKISSTKHMLLQQSMIGAFHLFAFCLHLSFDLVPLSLSFSYQCDQAWSFVVEQGIACLDLNFIRGFFPFPLLPFWSATSSLLLRVFIAEMGAMLLEELERLHIPTS